MTRNAGKRYFRVCVGQLACRPCIEAKPPMLYFMRSSVPRPTRKIRQTLQANICCAARRAVYRNKTQGSSKIIRNQLRSHLQISCFGWLYKSNGLILHAAACMHAQGVATNRFAGRSCQWHLHCQDARKSGDGALSSSSGSSCSGRSTSSSSSGGSGSNSGKSTGGGTAAARQRRQRPQQQQQPLHGAHMPYHQQAGT